MSGVIRDRLAAGEIVRLCAVGRIVHPVMVDMIGLAGGFDAVWLDQEHTGLPYEQIVVATACCRANGLDSFVRMAPTNYALVTQNLEAGAGGVMAARIDSAEQAEQFVQWAKFAPRGSRGMNTGGRDALFTHKPPARFAEDANREHLVLIQIETRGALEEVDRIAAIEGVDLLFVGPSDLSQALGHLGQLNHTAVWEGIDHVAAACRKHGKHWGIVPADADYASRVVEKGGRMLSLGSDVLFLRRGLQAVQETYADFFAS